MWVLCAHCTDHTSILLNFVILLLLMSVQRLRFSSVVVRPVARVSRTMDESYERHFAVSGILLLYWCIKQIIYLLLFLWSLLSRMEFLLVCIERSYKRGWAQNAINLIAINYNSLFWCAVCWVLWFARFRIKCHAMPIPVDTTKVVGVGDKFDAVDGKRCDVILS